LSTPERPPLSASFYANSFIKDGQNRYDLSKLATAFDPHGGGHANACGCRIQSPGLDSNLNDWIQMWNDRENVLRIN
jgi:nanoRNase/pAp phosphatase (c-di-AMP/oligoRNAs hydrolase)